MTSRNDIDPTPVGETPTLRGDRLEERGRPARIERPEEPDALSERPLHKGWHSRGYLPHLDAGVSVQAVTFRLFDSLPREVLDRWRRELGDDHDADDDQLRSRVASYLDAGHGECHLARPEIAHAVQDALFHFDGQRYRLLAWAVMPNHVHALVETFPGHPLPRVVHAWKSFTAKVANRVLGRSGRFWQPDYFDRYVRDQVHLARAIAYIHDNPVKAGLVDRPEAWPHSSASRSAAIRPV